MSGVGLVFLYLGSAETLAFDINVSFLVLFMVIIGGLGSILGSFLGAGFIVLLPILLTNAPRMIGLELDIATQKHLRSEEHTSELQSLMRISYAVFCLKKKKDKIKKQ